MTDRPNLVLLTVDSLRADYCGFGGSERGLTPNLDRLAEEGLVFSNAITPGPSTLDALPGIFTGRDLVSGGGSTEELLRHHLRARDPIPRRLSRLGYETAGFTANPWTSRYFGFDEGFDYFEDFLDEHGITADEAASDSTASYALRLLRNWRNEAGMVKSWDSFYDDVLSWIETASEPYFCWIFLVDVHMPYLPVDGFRSQSLPSTYAGNLWLYLNGHDPGALERVFRRRLRSAYADTVRYTDDRIGRFVDELDGDSVVTIHADHGEAFGENGVYGHGPTLSEEQVHVPLLVANGPAGRVEEPFSLRRLPALLETLARRGDPAALAEPYVGTRNRNPRFAIRGRDWKFCSSAEGEQLYAVGPEGVRERSDPALAARSRSLVERWRRGEREREDLSAAARVVAEEHSL